MKAFALLVLVSSSVLGAPPPPTPGSANPPKPNDQSKPSPPPPPPAQNPSSNNSSPKPANPGQKPGDKPATPSPPANPAPNNDKPGDKPASPSPNNGNPGDKLANPAPINDKPGDKPATPSPNNGKPATPPAPKKETLPLKSTNPKGFRPFIPVQKGNGPSSKPKRSKREITIDNQGVQSGLFVGSILAPVMFASPVGFAISGFLSGVMYFGSLVGGGHSQILTPDSIYNELFGRLTSQIDRQITNEKKADKEGAIQALSHKIEQQMVNYFRLFGINDDTEKVMEDIRNGKAEPPVISEDDVDSFVSPIHDLFLQNTDWQLPVSAVGATIPKTPDDLISPFAVLANPQKVGQPSWCLHTDKFNTVEGTELVLDASCDLAALTDKMFFINRQDKNRLILANNGRLMCVAYKDDGKDTKQPLVLFSMDSKQCKTDKFIRLRQDPKDKTWVLSDGKSDMCLGDHTKNKGTWAVPESRIISNEKIVIPTFAESAQAPKEIDLESRCLNNGQLKFQTILPVLLNVDDSNGGVGIDYFPPLTFEDLRLQMYFFPSFARTHVMALKELALFSYERKFKQYEMLFQEAIDDYKDWLDVNIPIYDRYALVKSIKNSENITIAAKEFRKDLEKANLDIPTLHDEFTQ